MNCVNHVNRNIRGAMGGNAADPGILRSATRGGFEIVFGGGVQFRDVLRI